FSPSYSFHSAAFAFSTNARTSTRRMRVTVYQFRRFSRRSDRQNYNLPAHLGLVHGAVEREQPLLVKREDVGRLLQCRQKDFHQHVGVGTDEHEVMVVVGLEVPEADLSRLVTMDADEGGCERIHLPEARDSGPRPR